MGKQTKALTAILERGLLATDAEVAAYPFSYDDIMMADCLLQGMNRAEIAQELGLSASALKERMLDPVRAGWISQQLSKMAEKRIGMVDAAVFAKALATGDPARARYLLERFEKLAPRKELRVNVNLDFTQLSDEELRAFVQDRKRRQGIVDVEAEEVKDGKGASVDGGGGENPPGHAGGPGGSGGETAPATRI
jgi:chorismate mutase